VDKLTFFLRLLPYLLCLCAGIHWILEAFFPSLRDPDFNRWEVDEGAESYVQIMGWKKVLTPPRVIAQGYMPDGVACALATVVGIIVVLFGTFGIRHVSGFPGFLPDLLNKF
jgi:hypothetical protein